MALDAGELSLTLEFAHGLKDKELLGRQDPYVVLVCGSQQYRSKTHVDGGKNPVWNETFRFNIINENDVSLTIMEADVLFANETIGVGRVSLARVRTAGSDRQQVAVYDKRKGKQRGTVQVSLSFVRNGAVAAGALGAAAHGGAHGMYAMPPYGGPGYGAMSGYLPAPPQYASAPPSPYHGALHTPPSPYYAASPSAPPSPYYGALAAPPSPYYGASPSAPPSPYYGAPPAAPQYAAPSLPYHSYHQPGPARHSPYGPSPYSAPPSPYVHTYPAHTGGYAAAPLSHPGGGYAPPSMYSRSVAIEPID